MIDFYEHGVGVRVDWNRHMCSIPMDKFALGRKNDPIKDTRNTDASSTLLTLCGYSWKGCFQGLNRCRPCGASDQGPLRRAFFVLALS